jgi:hypothetical protein
MKVREAVAELLQFPQDYDLMNDLGDEEIVRYYLTSYDDETGTHNYVAYETADVE